MAGRQEGHPACKKLGDGGGEHWFVQTVLQDRCYSCQPDMSNHCRQLRALTPTKEYHGLNVILLSYTTDCTLVLSDADYHPLQKFLLNAVNPPTDKSTKDHHGSSPALPSVDSRPLFTVSSQLL